MTAAAFPARLAVLLAVLLARDAWTWTLPQTPSASESPAAEGALDNDVFVPTSEPSAKALAEGDATLVRARAAKQVVEKERLLDAAFDSWRAALAGAGAVGSIWLDPAPNAERRVSEGVRAGILRRWNALEADERERWEQRLAPAALQALSEAHAAHAPMAREARLQELARAFPLTTAAAAAALELGDLALEAGLGARARAWYVRAAREAEQTDSAALRRALVLRRSALAADPGAPPRSEGEPWTRASAATLAGSVGWEAPRRGASIDPAGERWLRPGGVFLDDHHFLVQTENELLLFSLPASGAPELATRLRPADLLGSAPLEIDAPREPPGWPLLPLADEAGVVLVLGRTRPSEPNALVALELQEPRKSFGLDLGGSRSNAHLSWAIAGGERLDAASLASPVSELEELGDYEFQPGPVLVGERVLVQARQFEGQIRAWLLAFDRRDGSLAWKRQLAAGADRVATQRFDSAQKRIAGQPLLAFESEGELRVFAGTHLGLGVLLDGLTGEPLWSFRNRRRDEHDPGWNGDRPILGTGAGNERAILWAPMDSDRLYALRASPLATASAGEAASVLERRPAPLEDARMLLGGGAEEWLVLGGAGKERTVSQRRPGQDRIDALDLGQDERFRGRGLVSPTRVWVGTNRGLYLFDRTRELYLLDYEALPQAGAEAPGGDLFAHGENVLVVGSSALWWFRAR